MFNPLKNMNMNEKHPFEAFLPELSKILILGSFPCGNQEVGYGKWFYCGSGRNDFWRLLSKVFNLPVDTKEEMEELCKKNRIAITDIAFEVNRKKGTCSDSNLEIILVNRKPIQNCLDLGIDCVYCTSKFVEKLFKDNFPDYTGKTTTLLSPSPTVNRFIGGLDEYKNLKQTKQLENPFDYKLLKYKEAFNKNDNR